MIRFLVDEDVNQKALKKIPVQEKGFDVAYPEKSGLKGGPDPSVRKRAIEEGRTLVTCDKDFSKFHYKPEQFPQGVLLLRQDPRISQKRLDELLKSFCEFVVKTFPDNPYNFAWSIIEVHPDRIEVQKSEESTIYYYRRDQ